MPPLLLSFDVGIQHLAYCIVDVATRRVEHCDLTNLTKIIWKCRDPHCSIPHTEYTVDRVLHYLKKNEPLFSKCSVVLIEQQPMTGIQNVMDLLFMHFRNKAHLISPNAMHRHFNMPSDYDERKKFTHSLFCAASKSRQAHETFLKYHRRHDISDSVALALFWVQQQDIKAAAHDRASRPNRFQIYSYSS